MWVVMWPKNKTKQTNKQRKNKTTTRPDIGCGHSNLNLQVEELKIWHICPSLICDWFELDMPNWTLVTKLKWFRVWMHRTTNGKKVGQDKTSNNLSSYLKVQVQNVSHVNKATLTWGLHNILACWNIVIQGVQKHMFLQEMHIETHLIL